MRTGAFCYCYEKKKFISSASKGKGLMGSGFGFFQQVWIGKTGPLFKRES
jgi:hypothetical protein